MSFNSAEYWENRYSSGGGSGHGSYNMSAQFKGSTVTSLIEEFNIKTVVEFGHGDGNQLKFYKGFNSYVGYDISHSAGKLCKSLYKDRSDITIVDHISELPQSDLALSIDVIYHLVEQEVYEKYMENLFYNKSKHILIYTIDEDREESRHVKARKTSGYIKDNFTDYTLTRTIPGFGNQKNLVFLLYSLV